MTYVRFVVGGDDENFHLLDGVFGVAHRLKEAGKLEPYEADWLQSIFAWFNDNLPCPPFKKETQTRRLDQ